MKETDKLDISKSLKLFEEACTLIPGGVLGARKPTDFIAGEYPIFLENGEGCRLYDHRHLSPQACGAGSSGQ